jgi:hypothetical protein
MAVADTRLLPVALQVDMVLLLLLVRMDLLLLLLVRTDLLLLLLLLHTELVLLLLLWVAMEPTLLPLVAMAADLHLEDPWDLLLALILNYGIGSPL